MMLLIDSKKIIEIADIADSGFLVPFPVSVFEITLIKAKMEDANNNLFISWKYKVKGVGLFWILQN